MLLPQNIHNTWYDFLTPSRKKHIEAIEKQLVEPFNPTDHSVTLRFLEIDLTQVQVIWLGQDVYPAPYAATGRAFETNAIESWIQPFKQVSLKNIIRLIHKNYNKITNYDHIFKYSEIKKDIESGQFPIVSYSEWFDSLEKQGVLFLNTTFTCQAGKPNSHKKIWADFSQDLLQYISSKNPCIHWFLWGSEAQKNEKLISEGIFHKSRHPMMCSQKYEDDFLKSKCFENTWHLINWLG